MDGKIKEMAEARREKPAMRVLIIDDMNNPPAHEPGAIYMSKSRWKKLQRRQQATEHISIVVCRWCWLDGHGQHRRLAAVGTMSKNKETGMYEHEGHCPGKQDRDTAALALRATT